MTKADQNTNASTVADRVVSLIIGDLTDRSGLQNVWDELDEDIQEEIRQTWASFIENEIQMIDQR
jgi:hypothetical protein